MAQMVDIDEDQRVFDRFSARYPARFKDSRYDFGSNVTLRDASAEGVRIATKERLYLNDTVFLEVQLPDGNRPMAIKGQVMWTKNEELDIWDVGLRMFKVDLMHMARLYKFFSP